MMEEQAKKTKRYHNHSLMALASNTQGEATKKSIQADDTISFRPIAMSNNRKFLFSLPFTTDVAPIVKAFTQKFSGSLLHTEYDRKSALLILEGIKMGGLRQSFKNCLDYFVFCCSRGIKFGVLQESYNVLVITIKQDVIEDRCLILVANPYPKSYLAYLHKQILEPIEQELKMLGKQLQVPSEGHNRYKNISMDKQSPCQLEMHVYRKIYNLFVYQEHKQFQKYKLLLRNSIQIIQNQRERYQKKASSSLTKHSRPNPSSLIEVLVIQSQNLLTCLHNSYKQENHQGSYLHTLLASKCMRQITLYKIEQVLCLSQLPFVEETYIKNSYEQSISFNRNMEVLNAEFTDEDCFQHLQLKMKYRLTSERKPYQSGIQELRKIRYCVSLREMLLTIQECFSKVKSDCLMAHGGREELASMDDLLPVMIFVTVRAAVPDFPGIVRIVDDYVKFKNVFELEERILTTLQVAIEDISQKWIKKERQSAILMEN